jgi:hypothetical protein
MSISTFSIRPCFTPDFLLRGAERLGLPIFGAFIDSRPIGRDLMRPLLISQPRLQTD